MPALRPVAELIAELWRLNQAWRVLLDEGRPGVTTTGGQLAAMEAWLASTSSQYDGSGRQRGKSLTGLAIVDQENRAFDRTRCRWTGLTGETAHGIVAQAVDDWYVTCPTALRPKWTGEDLVWPNGSALIVIGTDAKSFRRGRGFGRIAIDVRDEYGFYQRPEEVNAALDPGLTVPGPNGRTGRVRYQTTPAESPAHESNATAEAHIIRRAFICETVFDNPRVDPEEVIRKQCDQSGATRDQLLNSTAFRREYKGERVIEEKRAAVPRWSEQRGADLTKHALVRHVPRPDFIDWYVGFDPGRRTDPHAVLLGWFDFATQHLHFEYELELPSVSVTTREVSLALKELEREAFGANEWNGTLLGAEEWVKRFKELPEFLQKAISERAPRQPYLRVGDDDDTMLKDLIIDHDLAIIPTEKHDKHLNADNFNDRVGLGRITCDPRCVRLAVQLATTIWDLKREKWERTTRDHGDLLDCAIYIDRNVNRDRDPRPKLPMGFDRQLPVHPWERATSIKRRLG